MLLRSRKAHNVIVFEVEGNIIGADGLLLHAAFRQALAQNGEISAFLINLEKTGLIDSFGMGALMTLQTEVAALAIQPKVAIVQPHTALGRLFALGGISEVLEQYPDEPTALRHLAVG